MKEELYKNIYIHVHGFLFLMNEQGWGKFIINYQK